MATIPYRAAGAALAYQAASVGGDKYAAGSGRVHVRNASGAPITVTIHAQQNCNQGFPHDLTYVVGAGTDVILGPFDTNRFDDGTGFIQLTYKDVTSLTVAVIA
jgi:hypothetical protein